MAMVAAIEAQSDYKFPYLPESNAVGEAGQSLRSDSETDLRDFLLGSVFWQRTRLLQKDILETSGSINVEEQLG